MALTVWAYRGSERTQPNQSFSFRRPDSGEVLSVTVSQAQQTHHSGGVWDAAAVLSEWAVGHHWEPGTRVLELGSGTGLASIVFSRLGCEVRATDLPEALGVLRENTKAEKVSVAPLTWGDPIVGAWDVVLLADCVFAEFDLQGLLASLQTLQTPTRLIFGYKRRLVKKEVLFFRKLGGKTIVHPIPPAYASTNVEIIEIRL